MCGSPARGSRVQRRRVFGWKAIGSVVPVAGCGSQATGGKIRRTLRICFLPFRGRRSPSDVEFRELMDKINASEKQRSASQFRVSKRLRKSWTKVAQNVHQKSAFPVRARARLGFNVGPSERSFF